MTALWGLLSTEPQGQMEHRDRPGGQGQGQHTHPHRDPEVEFNVILSPMKSKLNVRRLVPLLVILGTIALIGPSSALAAPPPNDNFANAQVVGPALPVSVTGDPAETTTEVGEPVRESSGFSIGSVWYAWSSAITGKVEVNVCGGFDPPSADVYIGNSVGALTRVSSGPDGGGCRTTLSATAGVSYKIAVDAYNSFPFSAPFTFELKQLNPPSNDDFANAQTIGPGLPVTVSASTLDATSEIGEYAHLTRGPDASVWYQWTPTTSVVATLSTCGNGAASTAAAYTGSSLASLEFPSFAYFKFCNKGFGPGSQFTFRAAAGTTYKIVVDAYEGDLGNFQLQLAVLPDSDGDGLPDYLDHCPTTAGPAENHGCPLPDLPDADGDGVPDNKDDCPDEVGPASNQGCAVHERPETTLKRSMINQKKRSATFTFTSDQPYSFFFCKIDDKKKVGCSSPQTYKKLRPGKHKFSVEAFTDYGGDGSPARKSFKIKKKKKKRRHHRRNIR